MRRWPWRKIFFILAILLIVTGLVPLGALLWHSWTHNFRPLSMKLPTAKGEYTSPEFKTDLDGYAIQLELMDATHRAIGLNPDAVIDLDWKIVDKTGNLIAKGTQDAPTLGGNEVNFGEYKPKRGLRQRMIVDVRNDIAEPADSTLTLQVNSLEDPEGAAFGFVIFSWWAGIVAGAGAALLLVLLILRIVRAGRGTSSRTPQTP